MDLGTVLMQLEVELVIIFAIGRTGHDSPSCVSFRFQYQNTSSL